MTGSGSSLRGAGRGRGGGSFCPNPKALSFTFKGAPNLFSAVFNASPVVKSWSYLCHVNETLIRRILNAVFILCQFQNTSAYNLCYSAIQYTPNYRLLYWLPKFQTLCFRLQQERVPVFRITTRAQNIADIALPNAANQKMSRILKNLINFRNREVLVADRLQSINLKFYASNQQVNLLFALFIFVLRRKK